MNEIDGKTIAQFLEKAVTKLKGDWVIIGGSCLHLFGLEQRVTIDIDIVGPANSTQQDTLILMDIAQSLGLPIEAINQAGAFFLEKIPHWQDQLVAVKRSKSAAIFRPDATLFIILKIQRLSETDLTDCINLLARDEINSEIRFPPILKSIKTEQRKFAKQDPKFRRLATLAKSIHKLQK